MGTFPAVLIPVKTAFTVPGLWALLTPCMRWEGETGCVWLREPRGPLGKEDLYLTVGALSVQDRLDCRGVCHRKPDVSGFPWVGEQGAVVGNVGLELDWKEHRIWVQSHRRVAGLSSGRVVRQTTAWLGWREGPAWGQGWPTGPAPPSLPLDLASITQLTPVLREDLW